MEIIIWAVMVGSCKKLTESFIYLQPASFYLEGGESQMKKGDKERGIWGAIVILAVVNGFGMGLEREAMHDE